jgi:SAM-dependent methyltransferase
MQKTSESPELLNWLTSLSDLARLRLIALLMQEELSVGELARSLQLPQSTVSRHLKLLLQGMWISKRSAGTASLYKARLESLAPGAQSLWKIAEQTLSGSTTFEEDALRLKEVLAERPSDSRAFFGRLGGEWNQLRSELFGQQFTLQASIGLLPKSWTVADLGCGTGDAAEILAPFVRRVIAIDRERAMLDVAKKRLQSFENIDFVCGEITQLPLEKASVDAAMCFLVLHHTPDPAQVFLEIGRIVGPGGQAIVVDMAKHDREGYRQSMGHIHLGFEADQVKQWGHDAGFSEVTITPLRIQTSAKGPPLFVASMSHA